MEYRWICKNLRSVCEAKRFEPFTSSDGQSLYNLKSTSLKTPLAQGLGRTEEKAKKSFEEHVAELYPGELVEL